MNVDGLEINPAEGHGVGVMYSPTGAPFSAGGSSEAILRWRDETRQESINRLGKERVEGMSWTHANVFPPNFSYLHDSSVLRVWMPKSPTEMEAWSWCIVDKKAPQEVKNAWRTQAIRHFSPVVLGNRTTARTGVTAQVLGGQEGVVTRLSKLHVEMGVGHERSHPTLPGKVSRTYSEQNQRSLYRRWGRVHGGGVLEGHLRAGAYGRGNRPKRHGEGGRILMSVLENTNTEVIDVARAVEKFYYKEARLLDDRLFTEWLTLWADDAHLWAPLRYNLSRREQQFEYSGEDDFGYFDDDKPNLEKRVRGVGDRAGVGRGSPRRAPGASLRTSKWSRTIPV